MIAKWMCGSYRDLYRFQCLEIGPIIDDDAEFVWACFSPTFCHSRHSVSHISFISFIHMRIHFDHVVHFLMSNFGWHTSHHITSHNFTSLQPICILNVTSREWRIFSIFKITSKRRKKMKNSATNRRIHNFFLYSWE